MFHYSFPKILRILNPETHLAQGICMRDCRLTPLRREVQVVQLCLTFCNPMDRSLPGTSVHGILQARILAWVAIPFSRGSSWPRDWSQVSDIVSRLSTLWAPREGHALAPQCLTLGQEDLLEEWVATHSSILAWRIQWTEEPGRLQSMGSQKVGHNWTTFTSFTFFSSGYCPHPLSSWYCLLNFWLFLSMMEVAYFHVFLLPSLNSALNSLCLATVCQLQGTLFTLYFIALSVSLETAHLSGLDNFSSLSFFRIILSGPPFRLHHYEWLI